MANMSSLANSISKFLRGDSRQPSAASKPTGTKPKTKPTSRTFNQALHTSTPETSLDSPPTLGGHPESSQSLSRSPIKQDPDTPNDSVEEIHSSSESKQHPLSQDYLDDGQSLDDRLKEILSSIAHLRSIRTQPDYRSVAPPPSCRLSEQNSQTQ